MMKSRYFLSRNSVGVYISNLDYYSHMFRDKIWGSKMAMVVVDPQRKFTLPIPEWEERSSAAIAGINRFAKIFRERNMPVFFIHYDGPSHVPYGKNDGDEWLEGIETAPTDIIVHKEHMSCFKQTVLEKELKDRGIDCILLAGMLTEFCVVSTYFSAIEREINGYMAKGALIQYDVKGNDATEVICNTTDEETIIRFLDGKQEPWGDVM